MFKTLQWEDWIGIALGAWLLVSPWVLGFSDYSAATINAGLLGIALMAAETLNLDVHDSMEEWFDIVLGLWLLVSPAVLGFASSQPATASTAATGLLTIAFAAWALSPMDAKCKAWWHERSVHH
jgi:hypothetical protein